MAIKAASLLIDIRAGIANLQTDMERAHKTVESAAKKIEGTLAAIGVGFSAKEFVDKIESAVASMAKLQDASEKTGASIESLSKLHFFAGLGGSSLDSVTGALAKLSKGMVSAGDDTAAFSQAMNYLGLSSKDSSGNLKDSSVLYEEIAKKLSGYADGAGKTAIAMALMGKSGADQLPIMKKMIELGDIEASVTAEQARQAEEYEVQVAKLNRQKEILWNTIASALLPSMKSVVEVMRDAAAGTDSLGSKTKKLAEDRSIEDWADSSAMGIARVIDVAKTLIGIMSEIEAPFERYFKASQYGFAALSIKLGPGSDSDKETALTMLREEAEQQQKILQARMAAGSFWTANVNTSTSDALAASIAKRKADRPPGYGEWSGPVDQYGQPVGEKPLNFQLASADKSAAELKLFTSNMQALTKEYFNMTAEGKYATVVWETQYGALQKLTDAHKLELMEMALKIDAYKRMIVIQEQSVELVKSLAIAREESLKIELSQGVAYRQQNDDMTFAVTLIGKTAKQQEILNAQRRIDLDLKQQLAALPVGDDGNWLSPQAAERMQAEAEKQKAIVADSISFRIAREREWSTGAAAAFNEYTDNATNAALQAKTAFAAAFKGLEDALFNFLRHGKLGITDFISVIKDQFARLAAQQITLNIVGSVGLGGAGGAASAAGGAASGMSALSTVGNLASVGRLIYGGIGGGVGSIGAGGVVTAAPVYEAGAMVAAGETASLASGAGISAALSSIGPVGWAAIAAAAIWGLSSSGSSRTASAQMSGLSSNSTIGRGGFSGSAWTAYGSSPTDLWGGSTFSGLPSDVSANFDAAIKKVFDDMETQAKALGMDTSALSSITVQMGATGQGVQKDMETALSKTADTVASALIPNLAALQQSGESLAQTFVRVTNAQLAAKAALDAQRRTMEIALMEAQGNAVGALAAKRQDEIKALDATLRPLQEQIYAAQDLATANQAAKVIADARYGMETQLLQVQGDTAALRARELETLDASLRPLQQQIYAAQDLATAQAALAKAQQDAGMVAQSAAQDAADAAMAASNQAVAAADALKTASAAVANAETTLRQAYKTQADILTQSVQKWTEAAKTLRDYSDTLTVASASGMGSYNLASSRFRTASALAQSGDAGAMSQLPALGEEFRAASEKYSATQNAYLSDIASIQNAVLASAVVADQQGSIAQRQLDVMTQQVNALIAINDSVITVDGSIRALNMARQVEAEAQAQAQAAAAARDAAQAQAQAAAAARDAAQAQAQAAAKAASDQAVAKALADTQAALAAYTAAQNASAAAAAAAAAAKAEQERVAAKAIADAAAAKAASDAAAAQVAQLQQNYAAAAATLQKTTSAISNWAASNGAAGITSAGDVTKGTYSTFSYPLQYKAQMDQLMAGYWADWSAAVAAWKAIPGHATGGLASGLSMVGEQGPELVDFRTPGRVYTAGQTGAMLGAANDDLLTEVRELRKDNAAMARRLDSIDKYTRRTSDTLVRVTRDGESMLTAVA